MKIFKGTGVVWDNEKNKPLCEFEGGHYDPKGNYEPGEFKTDNEEIIRKLEAAGYKPVQVVVEPVAEIAESAKDAPKEDKKAKKAKAE